MTEGGLRMHAVSVHIAGTQVLREVSLCAPAASFTALVGANGAGKSTVLRTLAGAIRPKQGQLLFDGVDLSTLPRRERARRVALLEQQTSTEQDLSAADVVALGRIPHLGMWAGPESADHDVIAEALDRVGATRLARRSYNTLSGGEQQRVRLAAALAQQPRLLLVDEPTNHLDIGAQLDALALLRGLADSGLTVVTALHDLSQALRVADHVVAMDDGRAVAAGAACEVLTPALIHRLYGVHADLLAHPVTGAAEFSFSRPEPAGAGTEQHRGSAGVSSPH